MTKTIRFKSIFMLFFAAILAFAAGLVLLPGRVSAESPELRPIARYEFADAENLGKDSMGNFDLLTYGNTLTTGSDEDGSYLNFAAGGGLYARDMPGYADFSDYFTDYTISFGLKRNVAASADWGPVIATGNGYANGTGDAGITIFAANGNVDVKLSGKDAATDYLSPAGEITADAWSEVTIVYDSGKQELRCYVDGALKGTHKAAFNLGLNAFAFGIGVRYNQYSDTLVDAGIATATAVDGSIRDVRIYDCAMTGQNVSDLYNGNKIVADASAVMIADVSVSANYRIRPETSDEELLSMVGLFEISATDTNGVVWNDLRCFYTDVERASDGTRTVRGVILDSRIRNGGGKTFSCEVGVYGTEDNVLVQPIARYEFADAENLGKDSMGNFDLLTYGNTLTTGSDEDGSYLNFAAGGGLYARDMPGYADFSDYFTDYTISFGLKRNVAASADWGPVIATGNGYANGTGDAGITIFAANGNVDVKLSGKDVATDYLSPAGEITADAWSEVTIVYDSGKQELRCYVDGALKGTHKAAFNLGLNAFAFGIGVRYNQYSDTLVDAGNATATAVDGSIRDVRIYDCAMTGQNVLDLVSGREIVLDGTEAIKSVTDVPAAGFKIDAALTDEEILSMKDLAPESVAVLTTSGGTATSPVIYSGIERTQTHALIKGLPFGGISNAAGVTFTVSVPFATEEDMGEIRPIARYEFADAENLGKDSMGNFDLDTKGLGLMQGEDGASLDFGNNITGYLRAKDLGGGKDFSDYLSSYTVSFLIKKDISGTDAWNETLVSAGSYESGLSVQGADGKLTAFLDADTFAQQADLNGSINADSFALVTVTYDAVTHKCTIYVNGIYAISAYGDDNNALAGVGDYAFTIGARSQFTGDNAFTIMTAGVIKDVRVYDFALSSQNVYDLLENDSDYASVLPERYISGAEAPAGDYLLTSGNTAQDILTALPEKIEATLGGGETEEVGVTWFLNAGTGQIFGILMADAANIGGIVVREEIKCLQEIVTEHAVLTDVRVNGESYEGTYALSFGDTLTFAVETEEYYAAEEILLNGNALTAADGVYTVSVAGYNKIEVIAEAVKYRICYHTDTQDGIVNRYYTVEDGDVGLLEVEKPGYVFEGWYLSPDFSGESVTALDSAAGKDIELWAKFTKVSYVVTFRYDDETLKTETVDFGGKATLWTPTLEGYVFTGWFADETLTEEYDFGTVLSDDLVLYAGFEKEDVGGANAGCGSVVGAGAAIGLCAAFIIARKRRQ